MYFYVLLWISHIIDYCCVTCHEYLYSHITTHSHSQCPYHPPSHPSSLPRKWKADPFPRPMFAGMGVFETEPKLGWIA